VTDGGSNGLTRNLWRIHVCVYMYMYMLTNNVTLPMYSISLDVEAIFILFRCDRHVCACISSCLEEP